MIVFAAAEEDVEGGGVGTAGTERVQGFVGFDGGFEVLVVDRGFHDDVHGYSGDFAVCVTQVVEDREGGCGERRGLL